MTMESPFIVVLLVQYEGSEYNSGVPLQYGSFIFIPKRSTEGRHGEEVLSLSGAAH